MYLCGLTIRIMEFFSIALVSAHSLSPLSGYSGLLTEYVQPALQTYLPGSVLRGTHREVMKEGKKNTRGKFIPCRSLLQVSTSLQSSYFDLIFSSVQHHSSPMEAGHLYLFIIYLLLTFKKAPSHHLTLKILFTLSPYQHTILSLSSFCFLRSLKMYFPHELGLHFWNEQAHCGLTLPPIITINFEQNTRSIYPLGLWKLRKAGRLGLKLGEMTYKGMNFPVVLFLFLQLCPEGIKVGY
jgi:hypothetical protein